MKLTLKRQENQSTFAKIIPGTLFVYEDHSGNAALFYKDIDCKIGRNIENGNGWPFKSTDTAYSIHKMSVEY